MSLEILHLVRSELSAVEHKLQSRSLIMRETNPIGSLELTPLERLIRPGVVLLGTRLFSFMSDRVVSLAAIIQFIHMARLMHGKVREPRSGVRGGSSARPVLLGDYFYGRFISLAAESGLTGFLRPLSEIMARAAESSILELSGESSSTEELVRDQTAGLFAGGMALAVELAGADSAEQETIRRFGLNLGMGYGLMDRGMSREATVYRDKALAQLEAFPDGLPRQALHNVVLNIFDRPVPQTVTGIER